MKEKLFLFTWWSVGTVEEMNRKLRVKGELYVLDLKPEMKAMRKIMRRKQKAFRPEILFFSYRCFIRGGELK